MLVSLTVGKVDAGVAVLLTEDKRLIEFPSILLPPDIHSGSIVDINVSRNFSAETVAEDKFNALQADLFSTFGTHSPSAPVLRCRNATQTSVVLEWDPISLATAELRSLSLYRNGAKAGNIPLGKLSTKISGLPLDTEFTFHLVLRTSAGQYTSEKLTVKTHKMTDLHGITISPGNMPSQLRDSLSETVNRIGAKLVDQVRIDTTHFVCTEPRGQQWEKAVEMNVPVVVPDWVLGCEREGRIVGVRAYYLDADPSKRVVGPSVQQQQQEGIGGGGSGGGGQRGSIGGVRDSPRIEHTPPTPEQVRPERGLPLRENGAADGRGSMEGQGGGGRGAAAAPSLAGTTLAEKDGEHEGKEDDEGEEDEDADDEEAADHKAIEAANAADRAKAAAAAAAASKEEDEDEDEEEDEQVDVPTETSVQEMVDAAEEDGRFDEVDL
ncbi:hypothetical protein LTR78_006959 [Recurvomyces mirabilis]|uniref:Chitin biosynthesis protein CHS5 n=1 Tax=Recurvomyces mirabilis TaxID=574656 RepID=A0AAE0WK04_9PEZI|nr:hypothetical protein LTR78_006959 [Recurvomyces mirabilis]KAK5153343.1 hypothetical protein LTS14_007512 [Recurvomyces mirabilis]